MMLFADKTKDLVLQSVEAARSATRDERARNSEEWEDFREGNQEKYIKPMPGESQDKFNKRVKIAFPFTDTLLTERATLYDEQPTRWFGDREDKEQSTPHDDLVKLWHDRAEDDGDHYGLGFHSLDKLTDLHGDMHVRVLPAFRVDADGTVVGYGDPKKNYPKLDFFAPHQVQVICDPDNPARAISVILLLGTADTRGSAARYQILTAETIGTYEGDKRVSSVANIIKRIPVVKFSNEIVQQYYWCVGNGVKICPQNKAFNSLWTNLCHLALTQMHGQPVGSNVDPMWAADPKFGTHEMISLGKDGTFEFAQPGGKVLELRDICVSVIEQTWNLCSVPFDRYRTSGTPESGRAILAKGSALEKYRNRRKMVFGAREKQLWRLAFSVMRAWSDRTSLPAPETIVIDYAEPDQLLTAEELRAGWEADLKTNIKSVVELYRAQNPDVAAKDVEAEIAANKRINDRILGRGGITLRDVVDSNDEASSEDETAPPALAEDVQKLALNGAQVSSLQAMLLSVGTGEVSKAAAIEFIQIALPSTAVEDARRLINAVKIRGQQAQP